MSYGKFIILASLLVKTVFAVCITVAAIHFNKPAILWWYCLAAFVGWTYESKKDKE